MKKLFSFILCSLFCLYSYGQSRTIQLIDSINQLPIPYGTVVFGNNEGFCYTDSLGRFRLKPDVKTLQATHLCYYSKNIETANLKGDFILLSPKVIQLEEAVVTSKKKKVKKIELGYADKADFLPKITTAGNRSVRNMVALYIPNDKPDTKRTITDIKAHLSNSGFWGEEEDGLFRVHLFAVDSVKKCPGEDLLLDNRVYASATQAKKNFTVDVSAFNIILPKEGIFVAIEWLVDAEFRQKKVRITSNGTSKKEYITIYETLPSLRMTSKIKEDYTWNHFPTYGWEFNGNRVFLVGKPDIINACMGINVVEN